MNQVVVSPVWAEHKVIVPIVPTILIDVVHTLFSTQLMPQYCLNHPDVVEFTHAIDLMSLVTIGGISGAIYALLARTTAPTLKTFVGAPANHAL